jgi:hypothetical protein
VQICVNMCICNSQILIYLYDYDTKPKSATKLQSIVSVDKASQDRCPRRIFTERVWPALDVVYNLCSILKLYYCLLLHLYTYKYNYVFHDSLT